MPRRAVGYVGYVSKRGIWQETVSRELAGTLISRKGSIDPKHMSKSMEFHSIGGWNILAAITSLSIQRKGDMNHRAELLKSEQGPKGLLLQTGPTMG